MNHYQSNLTDNQWQVIEKFLDMQVRKRKSDLKKQEGKAIQDKKTPKKQRKASYRKPSCTSGGT